MKKIIFIFILLVSSVFIIQANTTVKSASNQENLDKMPRAVLETANAWLYANVITSLDRSQGDAILLSSYTRLGKSLWEVGFNWIRGGVTYHAVLLINSKGTLLSVTTTS